MPSILAAAVLTRAEFDCASSPAMKHLGALLDRLGHAELQVAGLVAAKGQTGQVVALDEQAPNAKLAAWRGASCIGVGNSASGTRGTPAVT